MSVSPAAAQTRATFERTLARAPAVENPRDAAVAANGSVFVTDDRRHELIRIAPDGTVTVLEDGTDTFAQPHGVAIEAGRQLVVAERGHSAVIRFGFDGTRMSAFAGSVGGSIIRPIDVAPAPDGLLVVEQERLLRFRGGPDDPLGDPARWSVVRGGLGSLLAVTAVDASRAAVTDGLDRTVKLVDLDSGTILSSIGGDGTGPDDFRDPSGLAMRSNGDLLVADTFNDRVKVFPHQAGRTSLAPSHLLEADGIVRPGCVATSPDAARERLLTCTGVIDYPSYTGERRVDLFAFPATEAPEPSGSPTAAPEAPRQAPAPSPAPASRPADPWRCSRGIVVVCRRSRSASLRVVTRPGTRVRVMERRVTRRKVATRAGIAIVRMPRSHRRRAVRVVRVRTAGATATVRLR